jgi:hypothetical protein
VIKVDLVARLTNLFDHDKAVLLLDDPLDLRLHVLWDDDEPVSLGEDRLVHARRQIDLLKTNGLGALTVERHLRADAVKLRTLLDLPVHVPDDLFVPRCSPGEVHDPISGARADRCSRSCMAPTQPYARSRSRP